MILLKPDLDLGDVLVVIAPALEATLETGEPDWSARLAAAGTVLLSFPRQMRDTPENVRETLSRCLPEEVLDQAGMRERLDGERVHHALRAEWLRLPKWSPIRGLYHTPFPRAYVPPWDDHEAVCRRELPADIPPDEAPVRRLPGGRVLLERGPGELAPDVGGDRARRWGLIRDTRPV